MWQGKIVGHYLVLFMLCDGFLDVSVHLCLHVCFYLRWALSNCGGHSVSLLPEHGVQGSWLESFFNQTNFQQEDWHKWNKYPNLVSGTTLFIPFLGPKEGNTGLWHFRFFSLQGSFMLYWLVISWPCKLVSPVCLIVCQIG